MRCFNCGQILTGSRICPHCGADVKLYRQIVASSNFLYNEAIENAKNHELSAAKELLKRSLRLSKDNIDARNLLGLIYYEMGEVVMAIQEWSISRALRIEGNEAEGYLRDILDGSGREQISQVVHKFNTALTYCRNGSYDLAILQLRNCLSVYPNFLRARKVLALIYASSGEYEKAKNELKAVQRVDHSDPDVDLYVAEIDKRRKQEQEVPKKHAKKESVSYRSGNEMIIQPLGNYLSTPISVMLNLLIGVVIGALVVYFLVVPAMRASIKSTANQSVAEANEQLAAQESSTSSLQEQITNLENQIAAYESADAQDEETIEAYQYMIKYLSEDADGDEDAALAAFEKVDGDLLSGDAKTLYESLSEELQEEQLKEYYSEGTSAVSSKDYDEAIENLEACVEIDEEYKDGKALYYLAQAYRLNGDTEKAITTYKRVVELFEGDSIASNAETYIESLSEEADEDTDDEDNEN